MSIAAITGWTIEYIESLDVRIYIALVYWAENYQRRQILVQATALTYQALLKSPKGGGKARNYLRKQTKLVKPYKEVEGNLKSFIDMMHGKDLMAEKISGETVDAQQVSIHIPEE